MVEVKNARASASHTALVIHRPMAQEPAQRNLEQTGQIRQQQAVELAEQQAQQLDNPTHRDPHHSL